MNIPKYQKNMAVNTDSEIDVENRTTWNICTQVLLVEEENVHIKQNISIRNLEKCEMR